MYGLCVWLLSFCVMFLRFIDDVACQEFLYTAEEYSIVCINHILPSNQLLTFRVFPIFVYYG